MRRLLLGLALVAAWPVAARAQTETADQLRQAQDLYERLEIERALPLLRQVVSRGWPHDVTQEQRVEAYTYLGAALALLGMRDSAIAYFRDAIERDPFTDLDAQRFTPAQLALFGQARRLTFAVAVRPVAAARIDPRTERATLTVVSTHSASVRVELRPADRRSALVLFDGVNDGLRELGWDGLLPDGHLAPPGRSELAATQLLPERLQRSTGRSDLLKGLAVAAGALVVSRVAANGDLGGRGPALAIAVGGTAGIAGVAAFLSARHEHDLSANIEENNRRRAARAATNASIAQRNAARIAQTVLVIEPAAGVGP